jgi:putative phosphoribosyl transferase
MRFHDRAHAGRILAEKVLARLGPRPGAAVLALSRGGVPTALPIARLLGAPLDVFTVRKVALPAHPELAVGAIASGGVRLINEDVVNGFEVSDRELEAAFHEEEEELARREREYRGGRPPLRLEGRTAVIVDDGLATCATMRVAAAAVRLAHAGRVVVAVPVAPESTCRALRADADVVVCATTPEPFYAVGLFYERFPALTDEEVRRLLAEADRPREARDGGRRHGARGPNGPGSAAGALRAKTVEKGR